LIFRDRKVYQIECLSVKSCISVASIEFDGMFCSRIDSWNRCPKVSEFKWRDTEAETEAATTAAQERCTTQPALSAERHVKFPSSPMDPGPCTAAIATRSISQPVHPGRPEDTEPIIFLQSIASIGYISPKGIKMGQGWIIGPCMTYFCWNLKIVKY